MKFGLRYASLGLYSNGAAAVELAQAAEEAGFDSIWTVEHVVVPRDYQSKYPYSPTGRMGSGLEDFPIPDPLIWLAYIASATRSIKLGTAILILPQRNPVVTAKAIAKRDPKAIELTVSAPQDPKEIEALAKRGISRVAVPVSSGAGLPAQVKTPDDVLRYGKDVISRFR